MNLAATTQVLLLAYIFAFLLGFISHKTNFCTMGAVSDWVNMGNTARLGSWFLAIAVAILGVAILRSYFSVSLDFTVPLYQTSNFAWLRYILGGLMFGVGMTLAGGCASKTLINIGAGSFRSIVVLIAAALMSYLMTKTSFYENVFHGWINIFNIDLTVFKIRSQSLADISATLFGLKVTNTLYNILAVLLASVFLFMSLRSQTLRKSRALMFAGVSVGLIIVAGWYISGGPIGEAAIESFQWLDQRPAGMGVQSFTFINPMGELLVYLSSPSNSLLITYGVAAIFGVLSGSLISSLTSRNFRITTFTNKSDFVKHAIGGLLMGAGGVLAMGCTIGQGITGVSTLAVGSLLALSSILLGSALTMKVTFYKMIYEEASLMACFISALVDLNLLPQFMRKLDQP